VTVDEMIIARRLRRDDPSARRPALAPTVAQVPITATVTGRISGLVGRHSDLSANWPSPSGRAKCAATPHAAAATASTTATSTQNRRRCFGEWRRTLAASGTVTSEIPIKAATNGPMISWAAWTYPTAASPAMIPMKVSLSCADPLKIVFSAR
jgi:hypothetical protein